MVELCPRKPNISFKCPKCKMHLVQLTYPTLYLHKQLLFTDSFPVWPRDSLLVERILYHIALTWGKIQIHNSEVLIECVLLSHHCKVENLSQTVVKDCL